MKWKTAPIFPVFFARGFVDAVAPFVGLTKTEFTLSNTMASLILHMVFFIVGLLLAHTPLP